ncbi:ArsR family transcriptional regulator [Streptomyces sp. NBC_01187]|uniref:ArsR family transcriptional regulator n=1 Tax=Streptomyces sp. NBC_01187 TaxID=2903766 RepID=UPI002F910E34|nr:helix-turn-helix domain-containing protein [Streptomyces sp. NBC_01187]WSS46958.1 helix-turn-helix domain-containing protein [Streptomyces sp. NBC_01187]
MEGRGVITIPLSANQLAATRFAVSPLMQAAAVLHPHRPRVMGDGSLSYAEVSRVLQDQRLQLLAAMRQLVHAFAPVFYAPVFLTPPAPAGRTPEPEEDLHRVASAPSRLVASQLGSLLDVQPQHSHADFTARRILRRAADRGEVDFADRLARELDTFWLRGLSRSWSAVAARAADDIALRTQLLAEHGLGYALGSLHETVRHGNGALRLLDRHSAEVSAGGNLVLFPSPWAHTWLLSVDPQGRRPVYLIYPTSAGTASAPSGAANRSRGGSTTRDVLLADLKVPRTTTQLAAMHDLHPSTVSYHLAFLHRAGLITRVRDRNSVYYQHAKPLDTLASAEGTQ